MTDEQKDRLIVEALGGEWHDYKLSNGKGLSTCSCGNKGMAVWDYCVHANPNLATPEGFFWWWERVQKMKWWDCFLDWINLQYAKGYLGPEFNRCLEFMIHPIRGRDALAEWLVNNPEKWRK